MAGSHNLIRLPPTIASPLPALTSGKLSDKEKIMADHSVKSEYDSLKADFTQMRSDLAELTKAIGEKTSQEATHAEKTVRLQLHKAVDSADSLRRSSVTAIEQQINERPLVIMALAFGIGLLIGKVAHRR